MPRFVTVFVIALLTALGAPAARADAPARADTAPPAAPDDDAPAAGQCVEENQLKRCHVAGLGAVFEVSVARGTQLMVTVDEPLKRVIPPDDRYIDYVRRKGSRDFVVYELVRADLPTTMTSTLKTASSTITLRFRAVDEDPDLQVHILHTDRAKRDALLAQCKADYAAADGARYRKKLEQLDAIADRRARRRLLRQALGGDGASIVAPRGTTVERNDFVVLRANKVLRAGTWRLLQISVENLDRAALRLATIAAFSQTRGASVRIDADIQCDKTLIRGRDKARCVIGLGALDPLPAAARIRIVVTEKRGDRSVTLDAVDVR